MIAYLQYLSYVLRHKWYVFWECLKLGIPWRGLVHDLSKFRRDEWKPYVDYFHRRKVYPVRATNTGYKRPDYTGDMAFERAWFLHCSRHDHHWEWWLRTAPKTLWSIGSYDQTKPDVIQHPEYGDFWLDRAYYGEEHRRLMALEAALKSGVEPMPMSDKACREMLADWRGAGKAQGHPHTKVWYEQNRDKLILHPDTRAWIEEQLGIEPGTPAPTTAGHNRPRPKEQIA